jgi:hypothetical protein
MDRTSYLVQGKFGKMTFTPTSGTHIYATTNPGGGKPEQITPWVINGKTYKFITAHLYKHFDGVWRVGDAPGRQHMGLYFDGGTESAKRQARTVIEELAAAFVEARPDALKDAQDADTAAQLERLAAKRDALEAELADVRREIADLVGIPR